MPVSKNNSPVLRLIHEQEKAQAPRLLAAAVCAVIVSVGAVVLLGLSGWFLTASALAGMGGVLVAKAFNYMIPSAMIRLLAILRTAGRYGERITSHDAALHALASMRPKLFTALARSPASHSLGFTSGDTSSRLMQDVDAIQNRFVRLSAPWGAATAVMCGLIMCVFAGWKTALAVTTITLTGMLVAVLIGQRQSAPAGRDVQLAAGLFKDRMSSLVAAAPEIRAYAIEDMAKTSIKDRAASYDLAQLTLASSGATIMASQAAFMGLAVAAVYATTVSGHPALTALAILGAVASIDAAGTLMNAIRQNGSVKAASQRLDALIDQEVPSTDCTPLAARITLNGLEPLCPRNRIAIMGRSGSGKTTLIERMMHMRTPQEGEVMLDNRDVASASAQSARALFSYSPQQAYFINGTLADNLRLASPKASEAEMWEALQAACIDTRFRNVPTGLNTPLGENAGTLSGGERRRIGLARAYLRPAPFIVLDEPTEGLDPETEARVIENLDARLKATNQGLIMISHRPAPLQLCTRKAMVNGIDSTGRVLVEELSVQIAKQRQ